MLFYLGSGPVRGFAVTLAIGIITTVFTAFTFTRWLIAAVAEAASRPTQDSERAHQFPGQDRHRLHVDAQLDLRPVVDPLSVASVVLFMTINMNYGIDFKGGSMIEVQAKGGSPMRPTFARGCANSISATCRCRSSGPIAIC